MHGSELARMVAHLLGSTEAERRTALGHWRQQDPELAERLAQELGRAMRTARVLDVDTELLEPAGGHEVPGPAARLRPWLIPGERVGDWEVVAYHAGGGSSEVYRVRRQGEERLWAMKVVFAAGHAKARRNHGREVAAAAVEHPHLVRLIDFGEESGRGLLYLVMELADGPDLAQVLRHLAAAGRPLSAAERRLVVARVGEAARALAALHARRIVHHDIKPQNIVITGAPPECPLAGSVRVVDLGLAEPVRAVPRDDSTVQMTPSYAAPEVLLGQPATPGSDVFALGVTMHDLLTARLPAQRGVPHTAGLQPLGRLIADVEPDLAAIVDECCQPEPAQRYGDAQALAADLQAFLDGQPVRVRPRRVLGRLRRALRRDPHAMIRAVVRGGAWTAILLAAVLGLGYVVAGSVAALRARVDWTAGDLLGSSEHGARTPGWLAALLLPEDLREALTGRGDSAEVAVMARLRAGDRAAAARIAAAWLERDGLGTHPRLVGHLASEAARDLAEDAMTTLPSTANLLFQRPPLGPVDDAACAALRTLLRGAVTGASDGRVNHAAVAALGGCGEAQDLAVLVEGLEAAAAAGHRDLELSRLLAVAAERITQRRHRRGASWNPLVPEWLRRAARAMPAHEAGERVRVACRDWHRAALCWARAAGAAVDAGWEGGTAADDVPWVRGDAAAIASLRATVDWYPGIDRSVPRSRADELQSCWQLGYRCGLLDEPDLWDAIQARLPGLCATWNLGMEAARDLLHRGYLQGQGLRQGLDHDRAPDPGSRLRELLERHDPTEAAVQPMSPGHDPMRVEVSFRPSLPQAIGPVRGVHALACWWRRDDLHPEEHNVCLGVPGVSAVLVRYEAVGPAVHGAMLELFLQRAWRAALPHGGQVGIEVLDDGRPVARIDQVHIVISGSIVVPLGPGAGAREIAIRLTPESTGVLWLYGLTIR